MKIICCCFKKHLEVVSGSLLILSNGRTIAVAFVLLLACYRLQILFSFFFLDPFWNNLLPEVKNDIGSLSISHAEASWAGFWNFMLHGNGAASPITSGLSRLVSQVPGPGCPSGEGNGQEFKRNDWGVGIGSSATPILGGCFSLPKVWAGSVCCLCFAHHILYSTGIKFVQVTDLWSCECSTLRSHRSLGNV